MDNSIQIPTNFLSNLTLAEIKPSSGGCLCKCKTYEEHIRKMKYTLKFKR